MLTGTYFEGGTCFNNRFPLVGDPVFGKSQLCFAGITLDAELMEQNMVSPHNAIR